MKNVNTVLATLLLSASGMAIAQDTPPSFDDVDSNGDGAISSAELAASGLDISMEDADTNGDGSLDRSEYRTAVSDS